MKSKYFHSYQALFWSVMYLGLIVSIHLSRVLLENEVYFAGILVLSNILFSYVIRHFFIQYLSQKSIAIQLSYLLIQSSVGAILAVFGMVASILLIGFMGIIAIIPLDSLGFFIRSIFWQNWYTVFVMLVSWSFVYLFMIKLRQLYATKEALASSQLETLSQQLNPHFLFNTLNNIRASILENPEKARASIAQLADMLRYTLQDYKQSRVPLHIELKVVDEFIELCKIQYEDRLQFQVNVEEVTKTALIPRLLLQLCTENAIKHGIAKLKTGGVISLDISVYKSKYIQIQMHNPVISSRYSDLAQNAPAPLNIGVGLKNIRERLSLLYGKTHSNNYNFNFRVHENTAQLIITIPLEYT